jgi:single-stranded DNA-binding protein
MQTFKAHFKSVLAGVSDDFPIREWDELLPQTVLTLNLLRQSHVAPNISAYAYHHGSFDYNRMPLAPMGCAVQFHIKPDKRKTWGEHSMDGWYLKTSPEHYRCHIVFVKKTQATRVTDTVFFKHKYITQPEVKPADVIIKAYQDLRQALQSIKDPENAKQMQALEQIQEQLSPGNKMQIEQRIQRRHPRVQNTIMQKLTESTQQQPPRVQFVEPRGKSLQSTRMIVASPREHVIVSSSKSPQKEIVKPVPIIREPKYVAQEDSIAARLKARKAASSPNSVNARQASATTVAKADDESIAERLLRRKRQIVNSIEQAFPVLDPEKGQLLEYRQLLRHPKFKETWNISAANEFGRLAQGINGRVKATDTIKFIRKSEIPHDRLKDVTYIKFVCQVRTKKEEPNRTRATFGGNLIHYPDDVGTPTADLLLIKIFLNSVISTKGARFATADLSNFYLCTPMPRPEFGRVKLTDIPEEIIAEYKLREIATPDGWVYFRADKTHYGLPQAGSLSHDLLEK